MCRAGTATVCRLKSRLKSSLAAASRQSTLSAPRAYVQTQIERQKADFQRLGGLADWEAPYRTMDFQNEAGTLRAFARIFEKGYVFRGLKPVNWCFDCGSALAEAEIEYQDRVDTAIDVGFAFTEPERIAQ